MDPLVPIISPIKSNKVSSWDKCFVSGIFSCLKVSQNKISIELHWSISVFCTMQLVISTLIMTEPSCTGSIALKSIDMKVIGGILGALSVETMLTWLGNLKMSLVSRYYCTSSSKSPYNCVDDSLRIFPCLRNKQDQYDVIFKLIIWGWQIWD